MSAGTEIIFCPVCDEEIYRQVPHPITFKASIPTRYEPAAGDILTTMQIQAEKAYREQRARAEQACVKHYHERHHLRARLWLRFHWNFVVTFRPRLRRPRRRVGPDTKVYVFGGFD